MPERQPSLHSDTEIYKAVVELAKFCLIAVRQMPRDVKRLIGDLLGDETLWMGVALSRLARLPTADVPQAANSYLGLLRQASHGRHDRTVLANAVRRRGFAVDHALTKAYA